jgi:hypothetical protein
VHIKLFRVSAGRMAEMKQPQQDLRLWMSNQ